MDSIDSLNIELDALSSDVSQIENVLLGQIDVLAKAIPEIYACYASMVRSLVKSAMQIIQPGNKSANRVAIALEVGVRSIQAFGEYKAAKEHNRLLMKYLMVKDTIARNNIERVSNLLPKAASIASTSGRIFKKCSELSYNLTDMDDTKMTKIAAIQLKALTMYRTNIYLLELCKYLKNEYGVWLSRQQRSEYDMPDYYMINSIIANELFGDNLLQAYSNAADEEYRLSGKQIMLLSDYQMTFMALGERLCKINISNAQPCVKKLIEDCGAAQEYDNITKTYKSHIGHNPKYPVIILGILAAIAILSIVIFYFDGSMGAKWIIAIAGIAAVLRICVKGNKKTKINYVNQAIYLGESVDKQIESICGKIERPDIDYNERSLLKSTITGFFK